MDKNSILEYIEQNGGAEIPALQKQFNLSFKEARDIVTEQVAAKNLRYESGLWFSYVRKTVEYRPRPRVRVEADDEQKQTGEDNSARSKRMEAFLKEIQDRRLQHTRLKLAMFSPNATLWKEAEIKAAAAQEIDKLMLENKFSSLDELREHVFSLYEKDDGATELKQKELYERMIYELGQFTYKEFTALKTRLFTD